MATLPDLLEEILADTAPGAFPSIGERHEGGARRDAVNHVSFGRVIDIATDSASPCVHGVFSLSVIRDGK